jgi:hypothetical protein
MSTQGFAAPVGPCRGSCPAQRLKGALLRLVVTSFARKHEENGRSIQPSIVVARGEWLKAKRVLNGGQRPSGLALVECTQGDLDDHGRTWRAGAAEGFVEDSIDLVLAPGILEKVNEVNPVFGKPRIPATQLARQGQGVGGLAERDLAQACGEESQKTASNPIDATIADFHDRLLAVRTGFEVEGEYAQSAPGHRPQPFPVLRVSSISQNVLSLVKAKQT